MKVIYDLFPARVRACVGENVTDEQYESGTLTPHTRLVGSRLVDAVRVILTEETIMIAADSDKGPMLIFREKYVRESLRPDNPKPTRGVTCLKTVTGKVVIMEKDANCGCGSRLRGWNPYNTVYSTNDPVE
jgi:predicted NBD/HSP70 family sugar kinase